MSIACSVDFGSFLASASTDMVISSVLSQSQTAAPFEPGRREIRGPLELEQSRGTERVQKGGEGAQPAWMRRRQIELAPRAEKLQQQRVKIARQPSCAYAYAILRRCGQLSAHRDGGRDI